MDKRKLRNDLLITGAVLLAALVLLIVAFLTKKDGESVTVTVDGEVIARYPLWQDRTETVKTEYGENTLVISDGWADITAADCKNQICVNAHKIKHGGETITCLPHRLTVTVEGDGDIDLFQ